MRRLILGILFVLLTACSGGESGSALTTPPIPEGDDNVMALGNVGIAEGALYNDIAISGRHIYGCTGSVGIRVVKIQNDFSLKTVVESAAVPEGKGCRAITTAPDGTLYVGGQLSGSGSWLGRLPADGTGKVAKYITLADVQVQNLTATKKHVIAAVGDKGLVIFKRSKGNLVEVSALAVGFDQAMSTAVWQDKILVANGLSGVTVVNFADPSAPAIESHFDIYGTARRIQVHGDVAYVASVAGGVSAVDLTAANPFPPMGYWGTHSSSVDLALDDTGHVFVANFDDVSILDATDPAELTLIGTERAETPAGLNPRVVAVEHAFGAVFVAEWSGIWSYVVVQDRLAPDIHLTKSALDFGMVTSSKKGKGILFQNLGTEDLTLTSVTVDHPLFTAEADPSTLAPGEKGLLEIVFQPENSDPVETYLTLVTNDPDEGEVRIPISANSSKYLQVGQVFDKDGGLIYTEHATGNEVTVQQKYAGDVVILAYFGSS
jgi:hypothetical protein